MTIVLMGIAVVCLLQRQTQMRLQADNEMLRRELEELHEANQVLSNPLLNAANSVNTSAQQQSELLKLRSEVTRLGQQLKQVNQQNAQNRQLRASQAGADDSSPAPLPSSKAPFQIRLVMDAQTEDSETINDKSKPADTNSAPNSLYVQKTPLMDSTAIQSVQVSADASGRPQLDVVLTDQGRELFANITRDNVNKRLAIVMDGESYLAPIIRDEITGGKIQLTGSFTADQARVLAAKINTAISGQ